MTSTEQIIHNKNSIAQLVDNEIFYIEYLENTHSDVEDFKEGYNSYLTLLPEDKPVKVLVEMCIHATVSSEAREYAQANKIPAIAEALVLHSLPQRIIFTFYTRLRVQKHPVDIFKSYENALSWIRSLE